MWSYSITAPYTLTRVERDAPTEADLLPGELLLRVLAGGICGSDIPLYRGKVTTAFEDRSQGAVNVPGFPLHEVVGTVLASRHESYEVGDRVVGWADRHDGMSELLATSGESVTRVDDSLSSTDATLIQPLACVVHTLGRIPDLAGLRVAVVGLGPIGLLFTHAAKAAGAAHVIGVDPIDRSAIAADFGIDELVVSVSERWSLTLDEMEQPDVVIEVVGHQVGTLVSAMEAVKPEGTVFFFGVPDDAFYPLPMFAFFRKALTLVSGAVSRRAEALATAHQYALDHPGLLRSLISGEYHVSQAPEAYAVAATISSKRLKLVLDYTDGTDP